MLQVADQRGYFALATGGAQAVDKVATSLTPEDLDRLADNLVVVLAGFKELDEPVDPGIRPLLKQMRDPEVQRGLAAVLRVSCGRSGQTRPRAAEIASTNRRKTTWLPGSSQAKKSRSTTKAS